MSKKNDDRFVCVYEQRKKFGNTSIEVLVDTVTGVQYIWRDKDDANGIGAGFTVLVGSDGKPLLYQSPNNEV